MSSYLNHISSHAPARRVANIVLHVYINHEKKLHPCQPRQRSGTCHHDKSVFAVESFLNRLGCVHERMCDRVLPAPRTHICTAESRNGGVASPSAAVCLCLLYELRLLLGFLVGSVN